MTRPMPRPGAEDKSGSHITSHPFEPKDVWYGSCKTCNLAESAHRDTLLKRDERGKVLNPNGPYGE